MIKCPLMVKGAASGPWSNLRKSIVILKPFCQWEGRVEAGSFRMLPQVLGLDLLLQHQSVNWLIITP